MCVVLIVYRAHERTVGRMKKENKDEKIMEKELNNKREVHRISEESIKIFIFLPVQ